MKHSSAFLFAIVLFSSLSFATVKWSLATAEAISGRGVLASGNAIFASYNGKVYAVNATSGITTWTYDSGSKIILEPTLAGESIVAVASSKGKLALISTGDGKALVERQFQQPPVTLAAGGGMVFLAFEGNVTALDLNGTVVWNAPFASPIGQIGYSEGRVYFTSEAKLYSVDASTGEAKWAAGADDSFLSRPVRHLGGVYIGTTDGRMYSFDANSGRLRWFYPTGGWIMSTPLVTDNGVYFGSNDGYFYSVSPAGNLRFRYLTNDGVWTAPQAYESRGRQVVVFGTNDGKVYGLDAQDGTEQWAFSSYGKPTGTIRNGKEILFGTSSGRIYSLIPSPICSFTYPSSLETVGNFPLELEGRASADAGVSKVEVRTNKGDWVAAEGKGVWHASIDFTPVQPGAVTVECRARDNAGNLESGEYSFLMLIKSDTVPLQKMYLASPSDVDPKKSFNISVKDARGLDLRGVAFSIGGENKTSDSPLEVTLGRSGIVPITIAKPGFEPLSFTISGRGGSEILIIGAVAFVVVLALAYFFVIRKMLQKKK